MQLFVAILTLWLCPPAHAETEIIVIPKGGHYKLPAPQGQRVFVSQGKTLKVVEGGSHVALIGKKTGQSIVTVGDRQHRVQIIDPLDHDLYLKFSALTQNFMGLKVNIQNEQVAITGRLHRWQDWLKLSALQPSREYLFLAEVDSDVRGPAQNHFRELFLQHQLPPPEILWTPPISVQVPKLDPERLAKAQTLIQPYGLKLQMNDRQLDLAPLVRVQIIVAEVNRSHHQQLGLEWPGTYSAKVLPKTFQPQEIMVSLRALEQQGHGQILASPNLLSRSGAKAEFLAGGEFPIKIVGFGSRDVVWKKHGILLSIKPQADRDGRMSIEIETEVSTIDPGQTVDGLPGLRTNRIASHFDVRTPATIALSGLLKQELGKSQNGWPGLGQIPILGRLFSSEDYINKRSELVVFVTPTLVENTADKVQMPQHWNNTDGL